MPGEVLIVDGPVQPPEPDDGVGQEHLHTKLQDTQPSSIEQEGGNIQEYTEEKDKELQSRTVFGRL